MVKPKIGLSTLYCLGEPFKKTTERILKADTSYIEIVDEGFHALNRRRAQVLNELAASYGLKYTVHAPFADINIASPSKPILKAMLKRLVRSITYASALDAYMWVFHSGLKTGVSMFYPGMDWLQNMKTSRLLFEIADKHDVKIAIENTPEPYPFLMKSVEDFTKFYEEVGKDIGFVFDVGHANLNGQIERFLTVFANKIMHIHVSDNDGKNDQHLGIGYGNINWEKTVALIKKIAYRGIVVVESVEYVEQSISRLERLLG